MLRLLKLVTHFVHVGTTKLYLNDIPPAKEGVKIPWNGSHYIVLNLGILQKRAVWPYLPTSSSFLYDFLTFCSTHCHILLSSQGCFCLAGYYQRKPTKTAIKTRKRKQDSCWNQPPPLSKCPFNKIVNTLMKYKYNQGKKCTSMTFK